MSLYEVLLKSKYPAYITGNSSMHDSGPFKFGAQIFCPMTIEGTFVFSLLAKTDQPLFRKMSPRSPLQSEFILLQIWVIDIPGGPVGAASRDDAIYAKFFFKVRRAGKFFLRGTAGGPRRGARFASSCPLTLF